MRTSAKILRSAGVLIALHCVACATCDGGTPPADEPPPESRPDWLARVCVPSPAQLWGDVSRTLEVSYTVEQVASNLIGLSEEQFAGEVDWQRPMSLVFFESSSKALSRDGVVVVISRPESASALGQGVEERNVSTSKGQLYLRADPGAIAFSPASQLLAAGRAEARDFCAPGGSPLRLELSPELLESREVRAWVARQGAWLEASARQATASRGPSTLGDPEALARMLAGHLEETRGRTHEAAPLQINLTPTAEGALIDLTGGSSPLSGDSGDSPSRPPPLALIPPDAYFVVASWYESAPRRAQLRRIVDGWTRMAGANLEPEERERLGGPATRLAVLSDGWVVFALRPALRPGPLVAIAVIETSDVVAFERALIELGDVPREGYFHELFENFGAQISPNQLSRREPGWGSLQLEVTPPEGDEGERGSVLRTLMGESPTLAWRHKGTDTMLIAFGPEPERELARLFEASESSPSSILTQPLLAGAVESRPRPSFIGYGWTPGLGQLITRGAPSAQGLPQGGVALATGMMEDQWRGAAHLGPDQVRALLELLTSED